MDLGRSDDEFVVEQHFLSIHRMCLPKVALVVREHGISFLREV